MKQALQFSIIIITSFILFSCSTNQMSTKRYQKVQKVTIEVNKQDRQAPITQEAFEGVSIEETNKTEKIVHNKKKNKSVIAIDAPKSLESKNNKKVKNTAVAIAPKVTTLAQNKHIAIEKLDEFFASQDQKLEMQRPQGTSRWAYAITSISTAILSGIMLAVAILANFTIGAAFGMILATLAIIFGSLGIARKWKRSRIVAIIGLALGALLFVAWIVLIALYATGVIL